MTKTEDSVFEGSTEALLKRFIGGLICIFGLSFLLVGIVLNGVRWKLHWSGAFVLLLSSLFLLFLLEGTQIAVVRLKEGDHIPPTVFQQAPQVARLLTAMGKDGVANYLIGRQVLVCANVYLVASLTELHTPLVSRVITIFAGIATVVCFGQLIPQLMADINPILFCRIPGVRQVIHLSTFLSRCGVGHFSYWIGTMLLNYIAKKYDHPNDDVVDTGKDKWSIQPVDEPVDQLPKLRMQKLSTDIFETLGFPVDLNVKSQDHISPHLLLAISHGLCFPETSPKAEALLKEVLSNRAWVSDSKQKEVVTSFLRQKKVSVVTLI